MIKDIAWKDYLSDDERYADIINGIGCKGRQVITKTDLQEADTQTQNQETTDYSIPLRNMSYDVGEYGKQAAEIRKEIRKNPKGLCAGEYLYGFRKDSRLYPAITFILYSGEEEWDGPKSLHEILDFTDIPEELREMTADYKVNLIEIRKLKDTSVFKTDVRQVFDFIRCAGDKKALKEIVEKDEYYKNMEEDAFDVVVHYTNATKLIEIKDYYNGKDGKVNMCRALDELIEEGREAGREEGLRQGVDYFNKLIILLSEQNRMDDLVKAAHDKKYQEQLFQEMKFQQF